METEIQRNASRFLRPGRVRVVATAAAAAAVVERDAFKTGSTLSTRADGHASLTLETPVLLRLIPRHVVTHSWRVLSSRTGDPRAHEHGEEKQELRKERSAPVR